MQLRTLLSQTLLLVSALHSTALGAGASWTFTDGSVNVAAKGAGVGGGLKEQYVFETFILAAPQNQNIN